ncbi:hypothetical protein QEN19_002068 [Hanseniaspora menglaensis]
MHVANSKHFNSKVKNCENSRQITVSKHASNRDKLFKLLETHQEWCVLTIILILIYLSIKIYDKFKLICDLYVIKKRKYLIEHKTFPCTFTKRMHKGSRMNPQLRELWTHYMNENYIFKTLLKAKKLQNEIQLHISIVENLPLISNLSTYEAKLNDSVAPNHCTMENLNKERAVAEILTRKFYWIAQKDNFYYCRLSRYEKPVLVVDPSKFVGAWWHPEISEYIALGAPEWWLKCHYDPKDIYLPKFHLHKILKSDYEKFDA